MVKLVANQQQLALYFSRAPIPWDRDNFALSLTELPADTVFCRHIGIYAYRTAQLNHFVRWPVAPLEAIEKLEQLRFMWNNVAIHVAEALEPVPGGVDTESDLQAVIDFIKNQ